MNRLIYKDVRLRRYIGCLDFFRTPLLFFRTNVLLYRRASVFASSVFAEHHFRISARQGKPRNFFFTRFRNRCFVTGNAHSVDSKFRMSRMPLRESILAGHLHGVRKGSW